MALAGSRSRVQWVDIKGLSEHPDVSLSAYTLREYVGRGLISCRRRGIGSRARMEFNLQLVLEQLRRLRESKGVSVAGSEPESPSMFMLVDEIRQLRGEVENLRVAVLSSSPSK